MGPGTTRQVTCTQNDTTLTAPWHRHDSTLALPSQHLGIAGDNVAGIVPMDKVGPREIVLNSVHNGQNYFTYLPKSHALADTLVYPLLFPHGTKGWHDALRQRVLRDGQWHDGEGLKIKPSKFYRYLLMTRDQPQQLERDNIHRTYSLFHQFAIDAYVKTEDERLQYLSSPHGQKQIRADLYNNVQDALHDNEVIHLPPAPSTVHTLLFHAFTVLLLF